MQKLAWRVKLVADFGDGRRLKSRWPGSREKIGLFPNTRSDIGRGKTTYCGYPNRNCPRPSGDDG